MVMLWIKSLRYGFVACYLTGFFELPNMNRIGFQAVFPGRWLKPV